MTKPLAFAGLWASAARLRGEELPRLLRLVADYATGGVIITTDLLCESLYGRMTPFLSDGRARVNE
jgi:hypothetical protein